LDFPERGQNPGKRQDQNGRGQMNRKTDRQQDVHLRCFAKKFAKREEKVEVTQ
jgi:hypothetical protein